jgi:DNA end-binding protein Ku
MEQAGKVGIARVVIRSKESLVAIRPTGKVMTMFTMLFEDEVIEPDSLDEAPQNGTKTTKRELEMAKQLIDSLADDFEPGKYHDQYRERVLDLIERKAQGEEIAVQPPAEEPAKVPDLMAALEASINAVKGDGADGAGTARKQPARRKRSTSGASGNGAGKRGAGAKRSSRSGSSRAKSRK